MDRWSSPVSGDIDAGSITINTCYYMDDNGEINFNKAEAVRRGIEDIATNILMSCGNLRDAYRRYFPFLWSRREKIFADPKLFYVQSGRFDNMGDSMPVGAILKAMEEDPSTFQIRLGGGCGCGKRPLLIDYDQIYDSHWTVYTWCPVCQSRREIRAWNFQRAYQCERAVEEAMYDYNKVRTVSPLCIFDLVEALKDSSLRSE